MTPKFSIIVPIYNAEKTIMRCLKSIKQQTEPSFEVLLIDDGSKDASITICKQVALEDTRFNLYTQSNSGPSYARNRGLSLAKGNIVIFIDSDDFVESCFLECIINAFDQESKDVVFIGYSLSTMNGIKKKDFIPVIGKENYYKILIELSEQNMFGYTWIKAFTRKAIGECRFKESMDLFEDEVFTCEVLEKCHSVGVVPLPIYNYVVGSEQALTQKSHQDYCEKQDIVFKAWSKLLDTYPKKEEALQDKAEVALNACKYYGFERNIEVGKFFESLANSEFLSRCRGNDSFLIALRKKNIRVLKYMRRKYHFKIALVKLLENRKVNK